MKYLDIILFKTWADLRSEVSRAYIGFLWWFLEPILYMGAFYLVFGLGLRMGGEGFVYFLLCGLVPWKWFASTVGNGSKAIEAGAGMIHQVYLPKVVLPTIVVCINTVKFLMILSILVIFLVINGIEMSMPWISLFPVVFCQFALVWSLTSLGAAILPFVPDLRYVIDNGLLLLMFVSGVFFSIDSLNEPIRSLLYLNPVAVLLDAYRTVLLDSNWPSWSALANILVLSCLISSLALWILMALDRRYPKVL